MEKIIDAAVKLCGWCSLNEFPDKNTPKFNELTELIYALHTELRIANKMRLFSRTK